MWGLVAQPRPQLLTARRQRAVADRTRAFRHAGTCSLDLSLPLAAARQCAFTQSHPTPPALASLQTDLKQAATAARIAYCAAVLAQQAGPMLSTLSKNAFSGGKKGGGKGAKAAERGSGKGGAAAAASSRPVSRTSSAAALEAAGTGSGGGKAGKRKAAAAPENMRVTRSRH